MQSPQLQTEINQTVRIFVVQITEIAQRAAVETLQAAFGASVVSGSSVMTNGRMGRPRGRGRPKRTPADLESLATRLVDFVKDNPGLRIEQINKRLDTTTSELALPIRKLIQDGRLIVEGEKRATKYFSVLD